MGAQSFDVPLSRVPLVFGKPVLRIEPVELDQEPVTVDLGHNRGGGHTRALGVALMTGSWGPANDLMRTASVSR